jgi:hypothetical protein
VHVVSHIDGNQATRWGRIDGDAVSGVIQKLGSGVPLDIVGIEVSPPQLYVNPILVGSGAVVVFFILMQEARLADLPLVGGEENDVCAGRVHFVAFSWMDRLFLHCVYLQTLQLHIEHLAQVHHHALVDLLPQMGPEYLN